MTRPENAHAVDAPATVRPSEASFEELLAEGEAVPTAGWDFSWFDGRATEQRPSWGYARLIGERMAHVSAALDLQTGGGEVLASIPVAPERLVATESWPPNLAVSRRNLAPLGGVVVEVADHEDLPFESESFDLVVSRHPTVVIWPEIARVLRPGGTYLSQQVGAGSVRELTDFMMGPQPVGLERDPQRAVADAQAVGLSVLDVRPESLPMEFFDIAAVVHFLRKVIWIVPGFTVGQYRERLAELDRVIRAEGSFAATSERFLIEAQKPN
ncbi:methyltransferase domain-containing protein [Kribbella sp. NBC_01245]|uniref:class I SAM-dependent methyltransferase n=1 Tax=Kribbella sp. NBC_01245 TaxID=2903578 RepID=UPI002E2B595D|nr:methyltransferase domain-containing protein [Kribbella sp. NBC_01245]